MDKVLEGACNCIYYCIICLNITKPKIPASLQHTFQEILSNETCQYCQVLRTFSLRLRVYLRPFLEMHL